MADFSKFRSSLNGFNRSDVVAYIESLCAAHQAELQQVRNENEALNDQLEQLRIDLASQTQRADALQQELEDTKTALASTETALDEAMVMLTEEQTREPEEETPDYSTMELEAYRRAEAMDRSSSERAARLSQQMTDLLEQVSGRYEQTGQEIQALTEDIRINLKRLDEAMSDLDVIFEETTQSFDGMDPADILVAE